MDSAPYQCVTLGKLLLCLPDGAQHETDLFTVLLQRLSKVMHVKCSVQQPEWGTYSVSTNNGNDKSCWERSPSSSPSQRSYRQVSFYSLNMDSLESKDFFRIRSSLNRIDYSLKKQRFNISLQSALIFWVREEHQKNLQVVLLLKSSKSDSASAANKSSISHL